MFATPSYFLTISPDAESLDQATAFAFGTAFRTGMDRPGFALLNLGACDSHTLRECMVELKRLLAQRYEKETGRAWHYLSIGRFDQQTTTKFHLDGAPDESMLMLGYEPSAVVSRILLADYTRCAWEHGLTPRQYLDEHNPMFTEGANMLEGYVTELDAWSPGEAQVLLINNSAVPYEPGGHRMLGVLHKAEIVHPDPKKLRIVNSTMMFSAEADAPEPISAPEQSEFLRTTKVSGQKY